MCIGIDKNPVIICFPKANTEGSTNEAEIMKSNWCERLAIKYE